MIDRPRVLVIDDDVKLLDAVVLYLQRSGHEVIAAFDGRDGLQKMYRHRPDLVVLDIMMPGMDGWEVCSRIREVSEVPVIILTARSQEYDKIKGLKLGADDYLVKPFSLRELDARIEAILRRARRTDDDDVDLLYADGELTVDVKRWQVLRHDQPVELTATERRLLFFLVENAGRVLPTARILEGVWGADLVGQTEYVKLYVWRLRQKIEPDPEQPTYIVTERGVGYRFVPRREAHGGPTRDRHDL